MNKDAELNCAELQSVVARRNSQSRRSNSSNASSSTSSSRSNIKDMTIVEKIKVAELMAESNFTKQNLKIEVLW